MASNRSQAEEPYIFYTDRLILRLADPDIIEDCHKIIQTYNDGESGKGGQSKVGVQSIDDVLYKHRVFGPRAEFCTRAPPPKGMYLLVHLRNDKDFEGDYIGFVGISFRREMPYPDMGWSIFGPYQGQGYATEAGREGMRFWRDVIGVREIAAYTMEGNEKSQRLAERIGFVRAGTLDIFFGQSPHEEKALGRGFVLPGMQWRDGLWIRPSVQRAEEEDGRVEAKS